MSEPLAGGLWPGDVARLYGLPRKRSAAGQCVGVIAAGGAYLDSDLRRAAQGSGVAPPEVTYVGGAPSFGASLQADEELALDLQVLAGAAPGARLVVYPVQNGVEHLGAALLRAIRDEDNRPQVLVICWGSSEDVWPEPARAEVEAALAEAAARRISVVAASGDLLAGGGFTDGPHVFYPASSPNVLACGGTALRLDGKGRIRREDVWNDATSRIGSGGGVSQLFPQPDYQAGIASPAAWTGRGVPDVAAAAAFQPGWTIVVDGEVRASGGTSAAAPFWGGILALANARRDEPIGLPHEILYARLDLFREVVRGDNKVLGVGYDAGPGWNACTGLGAPRGARLLRALIASK